MLALMAERKQLRTLLRAKIGNKIDIAKFSSKNSANVSQITDHSFLRSECFEVVKYLLYI